MLNMIPRKAIQLNEKIKSCMEADQGLAFRKNLRLLLPKAEDVYSEKEALFRSHLGASLIGGECSRALWNNFHWVTEVKHQGRILRLFNRGHMEEPRVIAVLMLAGCVVWQYDANGKQFRINGYRGHFGGSLDGVVQGVPDMPEIPMLCEIKTHSTKSFCLLTQKGVREYKFQHYVQMMLYMGSYGLTHGLYVAVNKNDDDIYTEILEFDQEIYEKFMKRAEAIVDAKNPPARINNSPGWSACRFCDHHSVCHGIGTPVRNCRTCKHSSAIDNGAWLCSAFEKDHIIDEARQLQGCGVYEVLDSIKAKP